MNVPLLFSAKYLRRYLNTQLNFKAVQIAVNVFLSYVLELHRRHENHDHRKLVLAARHYYVAFCDIKPPEFGGCVDSKVNYNDAVLETILELVEVLEQHYLYDALGVVNELSNNYWIESLELNRLTRQCLHVLARCMHVLPAPPA